MHYPIPQELTAFSAQLPTPLYAVGGFVRDTLLGKESHDIDLCSSLLPEQIQAYAQSAGIPCPLVNSKLGTVLLCFGENRYEHTTFRTESYPAGGSHVPSEVHFTGLLEEDACRRDFSVNALYRNIQTGEIIDPTGGLSDLRNRVLRTTSRDPEIILRDDGLRILRLIRFAVQTGFSIEEATWQCACKNAALLDDIAWERKRQELDRLLTEGDTFLTLTLLKKCGALFRLIPELEAADGLPQRTDYHRYDVLTHLLHTCANMPASLPLRLMGLLHDIGKPSCLTETGNYHLHDVYGEAACRIILSRLTYSNAVIRRVSVAVRRHMFDLNGRAKEPTVRKRFVSFGKEGVEDLIVLREADIRGSGYDLGYTAEKWRSIYAAMQNSCPWSTEELSVSGKDLMDALSLSPSPKVSELKERLLLHCVCHPGDNTREKLLRLSRDFLTKEKASSR